MNTKEVKGKLYTSNVEGLKKINFTADIYLITRAGYDVNGTIRLKGLSPSPDLFQRYIKEWKDVSDPEKWWPYYKKIFSDELKTDEKLHDLRFIYKELLRGKNIVLVCFCKNHKYCHRSLVGDFFLEYGVKVTELNPAEFEPVFLDI
jgi:Protein of unknown function, DUF488.